MIDWRLITVPLLTRTLGVVECPTCGGRLRTSRWRWTCASCGLTGGTTELIQEVNRTSFGGAVRLLQGLASEISPDEVFPLKQNHYADYLDSKEWKARRRKVLKHEDSTCQGCGSEATDVHHWTYDRLGREQDDDLMACCRRCHALADALRERYEDAEKIFYVLQSVLQAAGWV